MQVRAEQVSMRSDLNAPITGELLYKMTYTRQVRLMTSVLMSALFLR